jgi:two-component system, cell cycle sensor histidine kinase and response regulator CckA
MSQAPIRVLLVEDDEDDYVIVLNHLHQIPRRKLEVEWVLNYTDAVIEIRENPYDVFIFDYRLGPDNGIDLMREVKGQGCTVPIVMLTRYADRYIEIKAREAGAAEFLLKRDANAESLERVILSALNKGGAALPSTPHNEPPRSYL